MAAMAALDGADLAVLRRSRIHATAPLGPGGRRFANAVVIVASALPLPEILRTIKKIESDFGRRGGQVWGDRVLDMDIIGAGAVIYRTKSLQIPHPRMASRRFVLDPLLEIAPDWRHPVLHATVRQLRQRAMRPKRRGHVAKRSGP